MLKPGTVIGGKYRLRHLIAEGGMAEVYLAESVHGTGSSELFALKRLLPKLAKNPLFVDMFACEASIASSLNHTTIAVCHDFIRDNGDHYMVLEYILGKEVGAIYSAIADLSLTSRTKLACFLGLKVAQALIYVHDAEDASGASLGIVHGDISPQNIMLTLAGEIKLYDFGASRMGGTAPNFEDDLVRGNLRYMAPEQLAGDKISPASDIFSLCLVMLEILTGGALLANRTEASIKEGIQWDPCSSIDAQLFLSEALQEFFKKGLSLDKNTRFRDCHEMTAALETVIAQFEWNDLPKIPSDLMSTINPAPTRAPSRQTQGSDHAKTILYLSIVTGGLSLLVWGILKICTDLFEPKHMHNIPYWPTTTNVAALVPAAPPLQEQAKSSPVLTKPNKSPEIVKKGTLFLMVKPWAEVFIDGKFIGSTPMAGIELPEGKYLVQLSNPDLSAVALKMVKIYADKKTELTHKF